MILIGCSFRDGVRWKMERYNGASLTLERSNNLDELYFLSI